MRRLLSFTLAYLLLFSSCSVETASHGGVTTPSATEVATEKPSSTLTPTAVPLPESLIAQKDVLEQNGFTLSETEITYKDVVGTERQVVMFKSDGRAVIKAFDENFKEAELTLAPNEVANIAFLRLNAGHDGLLVLKDNDGIVSEIFLPKIVYSIPQSDGTTKHVYASQLEAGWATPIDISNDPLDPTEVKSIEAFHSGLVLKSAQLKMDGAAWPEGTYPTTFYYNAGAQLIRHHGPVSKYASMEIAPEDKFGGNVTRRSVGALELQTRGGRTVVDLVESLVSDNGQTVIFSIGLRGDILDYKFRDDKSGKELSYIQDRIFGRPGAPYIEIYSSSNDQVNLGKGGFLATLVFSICTSTPIMSHGFFSRTLLTN